MKKIILLIACFTMWGHVSFAQGLTTRFGLGYAFAQAGQTMDGTATPFSGSITNSSPSGSGTSIYDLKKASFSSGLHAVVGLGYMFNKYIGIDASVDYMLGAKQYTFTDYNIAIGGVASNVDIIQSAPNTALFIPALVMQYPGDAVTVYTRVGVVLPINTRVTQDQIFTNLPGTGAVTSEDYTWEIKGKFSLGFSAALGMKINVSNRVKLWAEAGVLSLAVYTKEANLTDVSINGQGGYLQFVSASQRKVTYSNSFTSATNDYFHQPTYSQPFSSLGISAGLYYKLHGRSGGNTKGKNDVKSRRR